MKANVSGILLVCAIAVLGAVAAIKTSSTGVAQDTPNSAPGSTAGDRSSGTIINVIDVPGYTYAQVETVNGVIWAAAPSVSVQVGDTVSFTTGMPMKDFYSSSLQREFDVIYFVDRFVSSEGPTSIDGEAAAAHGSPGLQPGLRPVQKIRKANGGYTIAEIYERGEELRGESIRVRGQVVKFTTNVLNANWIRIRDGSTTEDLVITTNETVATNDILLIEGKLTIDKNLGQGYVIPAIIEDATISVE